MMGRYGDAIPTSTDKDITHSKMRTNQFLEKIEITQINVSSTLTVLSLPNLWPSDSHSNSFVTTKSEALRLPIKPWNQEMLVF